MRDDIEKTSFINLLPKETIEHIISFLPVQDWESLLTVSKEWQGAVIRSADSHHEAIRDKLEPLLSFNYKKMMDELDKKVSIYTVRKTYFATRVRDTFTLIDEVSLLKQPLAKLFHIQYKVWELMEEIEHTYKNSRIFFAQRSPIYSMLEPIKEQCRTLTHPDWFQKAVLCQGMTSIPNRFSDAFLEIEEMEEAKAAVEYK